MSALDRARDLGAEHGRETAEGWLACRKLGGCAGAPPDPDLSGDEDREICRAVGQHPDLCNWYSENEAVCDAYCDAFRAAVDETVRGRVDHA